MELANLNRNPEAVHKSLYTTKDNVLITKTGCKIYTPKRFLEQGLASIGTETYVVGIWAIVLENGDYGISLTNAMIPLTPTSTSQIVIGDEDYLEFYFEPGSSVIPNTMLIKSDVLVYLIYNEIIAKGKIPWFITYIDLHRLFDTADYHGNIKLAASHSILSMINAVIARDPEQRTVYYRQSVKEFRDVFTRPPEILAFDNIQFGATNLTAKFMGSYFDDSTTAGLVTPSERLEPIENILRT